MSPFKAQVGTNDVISYLSQVDTNEGGDGVVGDGTLFLNQQAAGLDLRGMMSVSVWKTFDDQGNGVAAGGRIFGGFVNTRNTGNVGTTKLWALDCWDNNILLHKIVRDAQLPITLTAGTFANQVQQLTTIIQIGGFSFVNMEIDATSGVEDLFTGSMPFVTYEGGHPYGWYIQQLCNTAQTLLALGGVVVSTSLSDIGSGYTGIPTVTVGAPPLGGTQATIAASISKLVASIAVGAGGTGYSGTPTVTVDAPSDPNGIRATATATVSGGHVTGIAVNYGGRGYTVVPTVTITGGGGSGATATATLTGYVSGLTITNPGAGYISAPALGFTGGGGSGAAATCSLSNIQNTILPSFYMGTETTFGVGDIFGGPVLNIYDAAQTPSIGLSFSDVPVAGRKAVLGTFARVTDFKSLSQRRQSWATVEGEQILVTAQNPVSQAAYPNNYINHTGTGSGYWMDPVTQDSTSTTGDQAQSTIDSIVSVSSEPPDTFTFETPERVMPGDVIGLGWALEGIPDDTPYRVVSVSATIEPPDVVWSKLTVNSRRIGLFDSQNQVFAPPIEGNNVIPDPPSSFAITSDTYDCATDDAIVVFAIGVSPSPSVAGYYIYGSVGGLPYQQDVGTNLIPSLFLPSNALYSLQASAYTSGHRTVSGGTPRSPLTGTTAHRPSAPHVPVIVSVGQFRDQAGYHLQAVVNKHAPGDDASGGGFIDFRGPHTDDHHIYPIPGDQVYPVTMLLNGVHAGDTYHVSAEILDGCLDPSGFCAETAYTVVDSTPHAPIITGVIVGDSGDGTFFADVEVSKFSGGDDASHGGAIEWHTGGGPTHHVDIPRDQTFPYTGRMYGFYANQSVVFNAYIINQWDEPSADSVDYPFTIAPDPLIIQGVPNPGFDRIMGFNPGDMPQPFDPLYWDRFVTGSAAAIRDTAEHYSGVASAKLSTVAVADEAFFTCVQFVQGTGNTTEFVFRCKGKASGAGKFLYVQLTRYTWSGTAWVPGATDTQIIGGIGTSWDDVTPTQITLGAGTGTFLVLSISNREAVNGACDLWIDDIKLDILVDGPGMTKNQTAGALLLTADYTPSPVVTGNWPMQRIPYAGTITKATIAADVSGAAVMDIVRGTLADYIAGTMTSIVASAPPTLSAQKAHEDSTLTGWTTAVAAEDCFVAKVNSVDGTIQALSLVLDITKS